MFKVVNNGKMGTRATKFSACIDLYSRIDTTIGAGETKIIPLGIKLDIEEFDDYFKKTHYLQLMLRSSLGKKGLILPNGVGVIDLDYTDEICIIIHNASDNNYEIKKGDRIGQITLIEHKSHLFGIDTDTERTGGFGSSGKR